MVHLGMDDEGDVPFTFEKRAYKGTYEDHDVDDKTPTADDLNGGGVWDKCPDVLETEIYVDGVLERVRGKVKDVKMCTSTNPGRYLCGYLYYTFLAALHVSGAKKTVMFVHVPPRYESKDIEPGVEVVTRVIEAIADQLYRWRESRRQTSRLVCEYQDREGGRQ